MIQFPEINYFHREYDFDVPNEDRHNSWSDLSWRVGHAALPLFSLYKPLQYPLAVGLGGIRAGRCLLLLCDDFGRLERSEKILGLVHIVLAVSAVAGTLFAYPVGMVITSGQDLLNAVYKLVEYLQLGDGRPELIRLEAADILNNTLFLALLVVGSLELAALSLAVQLIVSIVHAMHEYQEESRIEMAGRILFACARAVQLKELGDVLQLKWKIEQFFIPK